MGVPPTPTWARNTHCGFNAHLFQGPVADGAVAQASCSRRLVLLGCERKRSRLFSDVAMVFLFIDWCQFRPTLVAMSEKTWQQESTRSFGAG